MAITTNKFNADELVLADVVQQGWHLAKIKSSTFKDAQDELINIRAMADWARTQLGGMYGHMEAPWFDREEGVWFGIKLSRSLELDLNCQFIMAFKNADDFLMYKLQWASHLKK